MPETPSIDLLTGALALDQLPRSMLKIEVMVMGTTPGRDTSYQHEPIHTAINWNDKIQTRIPPNSTIIDVGAGQKSRYSRQELKARGHELVNIDQIYQKEEFRPAGGNVNVALDLETLPDFMKQVPLPRAVKILERRTPDYLRKQLRMLAQLVQLDNIGAYIFSHSLLYLQDPDARRVLAIAANNILPKGKIFIADRTNLSYRNIKSRGLGSKFHLAYELQAQDPTIKIEEDTLVVPALTQLQAQTIGALIDRGEKNLANALFEQWMSSREVHLSFISGKEWDNGDHCVDLGSGYIGSMEKAERFMVLGKK